MDPFDLFDSVPRAVFAVVLVLGVPGVLAYLRLRKLEARLDGIERRLARRSETQAAADGAALGGERLAPAARSRPSVPSADAVPPSAPATPTTREAAPGPIAGAAPLTPVGGPPSPPVRPATQSAAGWGSSAVVRPPKVGLPAPGLDPRGAQSDDARRDEPRDAQPDVEHDTPRDPAPKTLRRTAHAAQDTSWERWIGVRGAAVVGGIFLALAGILFFQYSIEHGWITPSLRVALGVLIGLGCFVASEPLHRRGYTSTAGAIAGAGAVILYAAIWAAYALLDLWPFALAFGAMALVTVACCLLALRRSSQLIATLGLVGGFATPLLLSTGEDHPIGLFGYLLLLDIGFLAVASRRRWPAVGLVGLLGTFVIQALWIVDRMRPETFAIGLVVLGAFAALFALVAGFTAREERARWTLAQVGALLLPFTFALYFAQHVDFGRELWPLAALAALLSAGASWTARRQALPQVPLAAAAGSTAIVWIWLASNSADPARALELVACCLGLAAVFHVFCEGARTRVEPTTKSSATLAALVASGLLLLALIAGAGRTPEMGPWLWVAGELALVLLIYRQATLSSADWLHVAASVVLGLGSMIWAQAHAWKAGAPSTAAWIALLLVLSAVLQVLVLMRRDSDGRRWTGWAACAFHVPAVLSMSSAHLFARGPTLVAIGGLLALGVASSSAASLARSGLWFGVGVALVSVQASALEGIRLEELARVGDLADLARLSDLSMLLALLALAALVFSAWPWFARARFTRDAWAWRAGSIAGILLFVGLEETIEIGWGRDAIAVLPLTLAALAGGIARRIKLAEIGAAGTEAAGNLRTGAIWYTACALFLACLALPLHLERGELLVTSTLFGAALIAHWRRRDHPPLKYLGLVLIAAATLGRLLVRTLEHFPLHEAQLVNWLAYDFLLPAAAAVAAAIWLAPLEIARLRAAERKLYSGNRALASGSAALCAIVLVFAWINLAILNYFGEEPRFALGGEREPARDLSISIAWALYALVLLGLGVQRRLSGLRWASLVLLIATIGKVFLFDLGNLEGLYRVASLAGLAISLLLVSLLYQRFVFRREPYTVPGG